MQTLQSIRLTSVEMGSLWVQYQNDSMAVCVLKYFLENVQDREIMSLIKFALNLSQKHVQNIGGIFQKEGIPLPIGFTEQDVIVSAPRLYSDPFYLYYIKGMGKFGMTAYALSLSLAARSDVRGFIREAIESSVEVDEKATTILLSKGLYVRPPHISIPDKVDFVEQKSFLGKIFGEKRPLLANEIAMLFNNSQNNILGKALLTGFSQVARSQQIRTYFLRGKEIANKHISTFSSLLAKDELPAPMGLEGDITDSKTSPFSDKLMLFHSLILNAGGLGNYGVSIAVGMRTDLAANYAMLMTEVGDYVKDGSNIMLQNGWMEEPPQADDRKALTKRH